MNKAAEKLGSDTVGKPENPQNLVRKKKGANTLIVFGCFPPSTTIPMILWELVHSDWPRLASGFNFSFKCGIWMECYMMSGRIRGAGEGYSQGNIYHLHFSGEM